MLRLLVQNYNTATKLTASENNRRPADTLAELRFERCSSGAAPLDNAFATTGEGEKSVAIAA